jgi:hypothetical protein
MKISCLSLEKPKWRDFKNLTKPIVLKKICGNEQCAKFIE